MGTSRGCRNGTALLVGVTALCALAGGVGSAPRGLAPLCGARIHLVIGCGAATNVHDTDEGRTSPCIVCHEAAFAATAKPKHTDLFEDTCQDCHTQTGWAVSQLHDLPAVSEKVCVRCHLAVYDATTAPKHDPMFPKECKDCHATNEWRPLPREIHESETVKKGTCFTCHAAQYKAAANPKHEGSLPNTCVDCHTTVAWKPRKGA